MQLDSYAWLKKLKKINNKSGEVKAQIQAIETRHKAVKDLRATGKPLSHYANAFFNYRDAMYQSPLGTVHSPGKDSMQIFELETKLGAPEAFTTMSLGILLSDEYLLSTVLDPKYALKLQYANDNPAKSFLLDVHTYMNYLTNRLQGADKSMIMRMPVSQDSVNHAVMSYSNTLLRCINWLVNRVNDDTLDAALLAAKKEGIEGDINHGFITILSYVADKNLELCKDISKEHRLLIAEQCITVANKLLERYPDCLHLYETLAKSCLLAARCREGYIAALRGIKIAEDTGFHFDCALLSLNAWRLIFHGALGPTVVVNQLKQWDEKARINLELSKKWLPAFNYETQVRQYQECTKVYRNVSADMRFPANLGGTFEQVITSGKLVVHANTKRRCDYCGKEDGTFRQCQCRKKRYCSVECQRKDWPLHQVYCDVPAAKRFEEKNKKNSGHSSSN